MKEIELSQGKVALLDDEDYEWLNQWKWYAVSCGWSFYAARSRRHNSPPTRMHRLILGAQSGQLVDHRDGDGLNNQRANLRFATHRQNSTHRIRGPRNRSGYRGVSWDKSSNKWRASIRLDGRVVHLGMFTDPVEAAHAYDAAAIAHHGEFATTNQ